MDEVIELRPCPYCGGKAEIAYSWRDRKFYVQCRSCGFEAVHEVLSEAFVEWENDTRWRVIAPKPAPAERRKCRAAHKKSKAEYQREYWRGYYALNRERIAEHHRKYYAANKERLAEYQRGYYAKKKAAAQQQEAD